MRWWVACDDDDEELWRNKRKGRWGRLVGGDTAGLIMDQVHAMLAPSISYKTFWLFSYSFRILIYLSTVHWEKFHLCITSCCWPSTACSLIIISVGNFLAVSGTSDNVLSEYPTCLHHDLSLILLRKTKMCLNTYNSVVWKVVVGCMHANYSGIVALT